MPKLTKAVPKYRKHRASGQAVVSIGGVDHYLGPLALKAVRQDMVARGWSRKYTNSQVGHLLRIFKWAVAEELLPASVLHALAAVPGLRKGRTEAPDHEPIAPVPENVVDVTLSHLPPVVADMVSGATAGRTVHNGQLPPGDPSGV